MIQNFSCEKTLRLLEPIVMFLSFSMYRLNGLSLALFDPKICSQHLQECLLKCLTCYEEMDRVQEENYSYSNRVVVEGIYLMLNVDDTAALQRGIQLDPNLKSSFIVRVTTKCSLNFHLRSFYKYLRDIQDLPHLVSAVASLKVPRVRKEILKVFTTAYSSSLKVPIDFLQRLLIYDDMQILIQDLNDLGISVSEEKPTAVKFDRKTFDSSKTIVCVDSGETFVFR